MKKIACIVISLSIIPKRGTEDVIYCDPKVSLGLWFRLSFFSELKKKEEKIEIHSFKLLRCAYSPTCSEHGWSNAVQACHVQYAKSIFMSLQGLGCSPSPYGGGPAAAAEQEPACCTICCCCCGGVPSKHKPRQGAGAGGAPLSHLVCQRK